MKASKLASVISLISTGYTYDAENRIEYANAGGVQYFYDGQNKRIWQTTCTSSCTPGPSWTLATEQINMFGPDGKQLASYGPIVTWTNSQTQLTLTFGAGAERAYFGGKLVAQTCTGGCGYLVAAGQDRLGSVGKYYPYGEDRSGQQGTDTVRFATYTRDSATGNDYADQRYYSSALGRFMTLDPGWIGTTATRPASWNRYSYVEGDPANYNDPRGRFLPAPQPLPPVPDPVLVPGLQYPIASQVPQDFTPSVTELGLSMVAFESTFLRNELNQYLDTLQSQNAPCLCKLEAMSGDSFAQLQTEVNNTQYLDMTSTFVAQLTAADVGLPTTISAQENLGAYAASNPFPAVAFTPGMNQPFVFLNQSFWISSLIASAFPGSQPQATSLLYQQQTLFHELWHETGAYDDGPDGANSVAFSNWLNNGCSGPPPPSPAQ